MLCLWFVKQAGDASVRPASPVLKLFHFWHETDYLTFTLIVFVTVVFPYLPLAAAVIFTFSV